MHRSFVRAGVLTMLLGATVAAAPGGVALAAVPKSGVCGSFHFNGTNIGPDYSINGSELTAGEVLHLTNNDSPSRPGTITLSILFGAEPPLQVVFAFGSSAQLTVQHSGASTVTIVTSDGGNQNVTSSCDAAASLTPSGAASRELIWMAAGLAAAGGALVTFTNRKRSAV